MGIGATSSGVKWPEREADNSLSSSSEVKNERRYTIIPPTRLHDMHAIASPLQLPFTFKLVWIRIEDVRWIVEPLYDTVTN